MDTVDYIAATPLFQDLLRRQIESLARIAVKRQYSKGQTIFSEGDEGTGFYVVTVGRVKIFKLSPDGKEQILHMMEAGEPFGEVAVFAGRSFPACAEASQQSSVLFFPRHDFIALIKNDPDLALNMLAILSSRLRTFARLIENLSLKDVPARLAAYFLYLMEKKESSPMIELDIPKGQLASILGTIPETLSRILFKMNKQKLITTSGSSIEILDPDGLKNIAEGLKKLP